MLYLQFFCEFYSYSPSVGERSIVMTVSVCVFVCLWSYLRNYTSHLYQFFCACYQWPWFGPPVAASRYVMYFRFYGWRHNCAYSRAAHRGRPADGSTAYMQPWTWLCCKRRVGIPVAGHGLTLTGLLIGRRGLLGSSWRVEYSCHHVCT